MYGQASSKSEIIDVFVLLWGVGSSEMSYCGDVGVVDLSIVDVNVLDILDYRLQKTATR